MSHAKKFKKFLPFEIKNLFQEKEKIGKSTIYQMPSEDLTFFEKYKYFELIIKLTFR